MGKGARRSRNALGVVQPSIPRADADAVERVRPVSRTRRRPTSRWLPPGRTAGIDDYRKGPGSAVRERSRTRRVVGSRSTPRSEKRTDRPPGCARRAGVSCPAGHVRAGFRDSAASRQLRKNSGAGKGMCMKKRGGSRTLAANLPPTSII